LPDSSDTSARRGDNIETDGVVAVEVTSETLPFHEAQLSSGCFAASDCVTGDCLSLANSAITDSALQQRDSNVAVNQRPSAAAGSCKNNIVDFLYHTIVASAGVS
jgi:hypothetical protein